LYVWRRPFRLLTADRGTGSDSDQTNVQNVSSAEQSEQNSTSSRQWDWAGQLARTTSWDSQVDEHWCVVTPFKDRWDLLETFISYYHQVWGVRAFCFVVGYSEPQNLEKMMSRLCRVVGQGAIVNASKRLHPTNPMPKLMEDPVWVQIAPSGESTKAGGEAITIFLLTYGTTKCTSHDSEWRPLLKELNALVHAHLPTTLDRILAVDSDEYLYHARVSDVKARSACLFHFLDHVPQAKFSLRNDMRWCVQPWYYAAHRIGPIHRTYAMDRSLSHWCKVFDFTREGFCKRGYGWEHLPLTNVSLDGTVCTQFDQLCASSRRASNTVSADSVLESSCICFHLAVLDKEFWISHKLESGYTDCNHNIRGEFDELYLQPKFPTLINNTLKDYWRNAEVG